MIFEYIILVSINGLFSCNYTLKVVVCGDDTTGKSALVCRLCDDTFSDDYICTIGIDFKIKTVDVDNKKIKLYLWDTAGAERFRSISTAFYRGANAVAILFDVSNKETFDHVPRWIDEAKENGSSAKLFLIGNKIDKERQVSQAKCQKLADELEVHYHEVSAKDGDNVLSSFKSIAKRVCDSMKPSPKFEQADPNLNMVESSSDEDDGEYPTLPADADDNQVLCAVGDPSTTVEYVSAIRKLFFALQDQQQTKRRWKQ